MNPEKLFDYLGDKGNQRASRLYPADGEVRTLNQQKRRSKNSGDVLRKRPRQDELVAGV